ncbi:MAG: preprotein translocase subunit SecE [Gemmatimonadetes bacterium]|jgi:preprotein translocase subunit SecE|nr:preprotein translocase subunit SecE [Gemmatimonadota bacterium]MDE0962267.1 preprotein translocase subunit SecE [Candidatus Latescibacterota bacterium]MBT5325830.1 preprotein translocase subunit SecE [Gemmatimonadota bacterium]MBT5449073.1 preprotein translocase subunit SecE [Gemmatimonadota bacterium]MBT5804552.1 preprotein translocase subunit SecE [Gemmatimonadota bacterium]
MWDKLTSFVKEVRAEFTKVSWPTREDLISSTGVVLAFSAVFAVFIGMFDLIISFIWGILLGQ